MSQLTERYFDAHARSFDSIYLGESRLTRWLNGVVRRAVYERFRIALQASGDVRGKTVLDVGCGSGRYAVEYARRGARHVVGIDLSAKMLALARALAVEQGIGDRCQFVQGDFLTLDFGEHYDVALAMGVFDYVADAEGFLRRMVAASQGLVIASFPGTSRVRMRFRQFRYRLRNCPLFFYTRDDLERIVRAAGLSDYELVFMPFSGTGYVLIGRVAQA